MIKSKALNLTVSAALLLSMTAVAGCGNANNGKANNGNTTRTNNVDGGRVGVNSIRNNQTPTGTQHDLTNLKYSRELSAKVSRVSGVGSAHVFVTNRNAYVSLALDNQNGGAQTNSINGRTTGISPGTGRTMTTRTRSNAMDGTYNTSTGSVGLLRDMTDNTRRTVDNNTGFGTGLGGNADTRGFGVRGTTRNNGFADGGFNTMNTPRTNTMTGTRGTDGNMNDTRIGTGINGVPYGTYNGNNMGMMNTNNNANDVPQHIRMEISSKIRKTAPHIQQVYVSSDQDFYQQANGFATNGNAGNTFGTLSRDFGSWINRIFPLNLGGRDGMNDTRGNLMRNDTDDGWFGGNRNSR